MALDPHEEFFVTGSAEGDIKVKLYLFVVKMCIYVSVYQRSAKFAIMINHFWKKIVYWIPPAFWLAEHEFDSGSKIGSMGGGVNFNFLRISRKLSKFGQKKTFL